MHIVRYADNSVQNSEWTGRIQNIRDLVLNSNNTLRKDMTEQITQLEGKLNGKIDETNKKLDQLLTLLQKEKKEE